MASDSYGYGALSSINWNTHRWPPPHVAALTEEVVVTKSFPPLTAVIPGPGEPGKRMPSAGTVIGDTHLNPSTQIPGQTARFDY